MSLISIWTSHTPDLQQFRWKNRILLVCAPTETDARVLQQSQLIQASSAGFQDRDLLVFVVANQPSLYSRFHLKTDDFTVLLIGKDGTEKLRQHSLIRPEKLFEIIDSMPMRRAGER